MLFSFWNYILYLLKLGLELLKQHNQAEIFKKIGNFILAS